MKNVYTLFYHKRYYLKLKGLGFSFKYLAVPQHTLLLNIGFSKMRFVKIPQTISIIKKPRKKKYIFILTSTDLNILLIFTTLLRKLKIPDPYKIKGFRYVQESIKVKTGKKKK
jgi:ribosomal protein L6P/L9E